MRAATPPGGDSDRWAAQALAWLARFPLLGEHQVGRLVGVDSSTATDTLGQLRRRGLVAVLLVDSPEFPATRRLHVLTETGAARLAVCLGVPPAELARRFPVSRAEVLARLARVETAVAVADFVAALTEALRRCEGEAASAMVEDARGTFWVRSRGGGRGNTPGAVEAALRLRMGGARATCFLAWDRAAAPPAHRRLRAVSWYAADGARDAARDPSSPDVLVVCPDERTGRQWDALAEGDALRHGRAVLPIAIAIGRELRARGPLGAVWRRPGGTTRAGLLERLTWRASASVRPAVTIAPTPIRRTEEEPPADAATESLHGWAQAAIRSDDALARLTDAERWAALSIGLSATQKTLLAWVGHHPLLGPAPLAACLERPERDVVRLMAGLQRCGLVALETGRPAREGVGPGYVLTPYGAGYLAARDGVPRGRYLALGVLAAEGSPADERRAPGAGGPPLAQVRLADLRRHPEHTAGVHRFALALAREAARRRARGDDHRLLAWLSAAEAQQWFGHAGRWWHVWPDAQFRYRADGVVYDLLLEWDRGLVRRRDYARKFASYAAYLGARGGPGEEQLRLVVATTPAAALRVQGAVTAASRNCPQLERVTAIIDHRAVDEGRITAALWPAPTGADVEE